MRVICTAGHVDHGKSTLVQAISGIQPDRLREEIEREMTIDLGFAWIDLPTGETVGIVDVPGHEDFIENMLAGIGGLDAALLIVAADEGVMPQTREHLAILELMGMQHGVVALTKIDAAESDDWIELVELDILDLLSGGSLRDAPIVRVSAHTGQGLDALVSTLTDVLDEQAPREDHGAPVLPIDRVFTLSGFGTVVTGTLSDGQLETGDTVEIQPSGLQARIRGMQSHDQPIEVAQPGSRVAVNLSGVDKSDVQRGHVLARPGFIQPTLLFDAVFVHLADAARLLQHNTEVKVFVGPSESLAKIRILDADELAPGQESFVQFQLNQALPIRADQRFVVRIPSPAETIGGGWVLDTGPGRKWKRNQAAVLERFEVLAYGDAAAKLAYTLKHARTPLPVDEFAPPVVFDAIADYGLIEMDGYLAHPDAIQRLSEAATRILDAFHNENPLLVGMDPAELMRQLHVSDSIVLRILAATNTIEYANLVNLPGRGMQFTKAQRRSIDDLLHAFDDAPYSPPSYKEAEKKLSRDILKALVVQGELVFLRPDLLLRPDAYYALIDYARERLETGKGLSVAGLRDDFQTSRRVALPFLDFLEAQGITKRHDDQHILANPNWDIL